MPPKNSKQLAGELVEAARSGNVARVAELIAEGAKPDQRPTGGTTALIAAVRGGQIEIVKVLLAAGADPSFKDGGKTGTTALLEAIRHEQFETGCALLAAGSEVHHDWSGEGQNIAYEAIEKCNEICREAFVPSPQNMMGVIYKGKGPDAKAKAERQYPASVKLVQMILEVGGRPGLRPGLADTAGTGNLQLLRLLLTHGADVNQQEKYSSTAFAYAVSQCRLEAARELLKAGANPNIGETIFGPPFHVAALEGMKELAQAIVDSGGDLNARATVSLKEPEESAVFGRKDADHFVLNVDPSRRPPAKARGSTPLVVAVRAGQTEIVRILVAGKANLEIPDADGFTPLAWAMKRGREEIATLLREAGAKEPEHLEGSAFRILFEACAKGDTEKARAAIAEGADVNRANDTTREQFTPLMVASGKGHLDIVSALLDAGADPNFAGREEALTIVGPLMLAARHGHVAVVERLLAAGAGVSLPERSLLKLREEGDTPLHEAARNGHAKVLEVLLKTGLDPAAKSAWSDSALVLAVRRRSAESVKVLLAAGAKPVSRGLKANAVLEAAKESYDPDVFSLIEKAISAAEGKGNA